jgi:hypothetical protein
LVDEAKRVDANAAQLVTDGVLCGKSDMQTHITHISGMTTGSHQGSGKHAVDCHAVLKMELDAVVLGLDKLLGNQGPAT